MTERRGIRPLYFNQRSDRFSKGMKNRKSTGADDIADLGITVEVKE